MFDRVFVNRVLAVAMLGLASACQAQSPAPAAAAGFVAGTDYDLLDPVQPTATGDKIEVFEVFGYWCIHCATADLAIKSWLAKLPADVMFSYVPAIFSGEVHEIYARAFYTAETMGVLGKTHAGMLKAAAVDRTIKSPEDIIAFYVAQGIDRGAFEATMNSFAVNAKIARNKQSLPRYGIAATPTMIVAGKYRVMGGAEQMLKVVDFLIEKERAAKG